MTAARTLASAALLLTLVGGCGGAPAPRTGDPQATAKTAEAGTKPPPFSAGVAPTLPPPEDPAKAAAACRAGDPKECAHAARLYFDGWGIPRDMVRVAAYGGLACSSGSDDLCALRDLAYFADHAYHFSPGVRAYKTYLESSSVEPIARPAFCTKLVSRDAWGFAAYHASNCHRAEAEATLAETAVKPNEESANVEAACFRDGEVAACRGLSMTKRLEDDDRVKFAPMCRRTGAMCDVAKGTTDEETARFRAQACLGRLYGACNDWGALLQKLGHALDRRMSERLQAEICLHPEEGYVPRSVGQAGDGQGTDEDCAPGRFTALAASKDAGDQALIRALAHSPEELGGADCTGRFYDAHACVLFAFGLDKDALGLRAYRVPEEQRWKERMDTLVNLCEKPPPFAADKVELENLCSSRKSIEGQYKAFIAQNGRKGARP